MSSEHSNLDIGSDDVELGYWIGVPFLGARTDSEAAEALIQYGFDRLGVRNIWCGYFEGTINLKGFRRNAVLNSITQKRTSLGL